jgi:AraC-like DNA-binding protein
MMDTRFQPLASTGAYSVGVWSCVCPEPAPHGDERAELHEIILPTRGMFVREIEGEREVVDATRVVFGNPGEWYRVWHPVAGGDECTLLMLEPPLAEALAGATGALRSAGGVPRIPERQRPADGRLYRQHRELVRLLAAGGADPVEVDERVHRIAFAAMAGRRTGARAGAVRPGARRQQERALARALEVMHLRHGERLTLDEIAREAAYSPFHLARLFHARLGLPVHRYLNRLRLRAAFEAVLGGDDLTTIALDHGFSSHSHFTRAFAREYGLPPAALRGAHPTASQSSPSP